MKRFLFRLFYWLNLHKLAKKIDPIAYYFYHFNDTFFCYMKQAFENLTVDKHEFDDTLLSKEFASDPNECDKVYDAVLNGLANIPKE